MSPPNSPLPTYSTSFSKGVFIAPLNKYTFKTSTLWLVGIAHPALASFPGDWLKGHPFPTAGESHPSQHTVHPVYIGLI
jgi:hypothetical protein